MAETICVGSAQLGDEPGASHVSLGSSCNAEASAHHHKSNQMIEDA